MRVLTVAGGVVAAGALLAVPSVIWPTVSVGIRPDSLLVPGEDPAVVFRFEMWSWGRVASQGFDVEGGATGGSPGSLALLVAAIVLALTAAGLLSLGRAAAATPVAAALTGFALAILGSNVVDRLFRDDSSFGAPGQQVEVSSTAAGLLETGSVALLVLALALMLAGPVRLTGLDLQDRFRSRDGGGGGGAADHPGSGASNPAAPGPDDDESGPTAPVVRDAGPREARRSTGPVTGVGFSDD